MRFNPLFMDRAIELAQLAYTSKKGLPIGCVIVKEEKIVGEGHNEIFLRTNPTSHAEMVAIENACSNMGSLDLSGCALYTTLEPCPMCLAGVYWDRLEVIYYACSNEDATEIGFSDSFIFNELVASPDKRLIQAHHILSQGAKKVMQDWKSQGISARQPW